MHDKNGKEIHVGDYVRVEAAYLGGKKIGQVTKLHPGATTCNVEVGIMVPTVMVSTQVATAGEMEIVEP
jgi:hypothetical protein